MRVRQVPLSLFNQTVFRVSLPLEVIFTFVRFVFIHCLLLLLAFVTLFSLVSACFLAIPSTVSRASSVMQNDNTNKQTKGAAYSLRRRLRKSLREDSTADRRSVRLRLTQLAYNLAFTCTRIKGSGNTACNTVLEHPRHFEAQKNKRGYENN